MSKQDEYLWDPLSEPDAEIAALEAKLRPFGASALRLADRPFPISTQRPFAVAWRYAAGFVGILLLGVAAFEYRLSWSEGAPWKVIVQDQLGTHATLLHVEERIATQRGESLTLGAARIGTVTVSPESTVRLVETRKGRHRLELEHGRLRAKIWAPPNYFAVGSGTSRFVDLGCEFELEMNPAGDGELFVTSGFVIHRAGDRELLVPAGYRVTLSDHRASTPVRRDASEEFRSAVIVLDRLMSAGDLGAVAALSPKSRGLTDTIAALSVDADYFTLLDLLVRHTSLAKTELYPRLATMLDEPNDELHRLQWIQGDPRAREQWWRKIPRQPKTWWLNWRDAF